MNLIYQSVIFRACPEGGFNRAALSDVMGGYDCPLMIYLGKSEQDPGRSSVSNLALLQWANELIPNPCPARVQSHPKQDKVQLLTGGFIVTQPAWVQLAVR